MGGRWSIRDLVVLSGQAPDGRDVIGRIELLAPPYAGPEPWPWVPPSDLPTASSALLAIEPAYLVDARSILLSYLGRFRRVYPQVPICFIVEAHRGAAPEEADIVRPYRRFTRAILPWPYDRGAFRSAVCRIASSDLRHWLTWTVRPTRSSEWGAIAYLSSLFGSVDPGAGLEPGIDLDDLRRTLRRMSLPSPKRWDMLVRALPAVLRVQRDEQPIHEVARTHGYPASRAFRRHCANLFGASPSTLRRYAGWEPLLWRFIDVG